MLKKKKTSSRGNTLLTCNYQLPRVTSIRPHQPGLGTNWKTRWAMSGRHFPSLRDVAAVSRAPPAKLPPFFIQETEFLRGGVIAPDTE